MDKAQRSKFTKIAAGIAAAAVVVLGGMYIAGSASGSVPPATVDFANISAEQKQKLFDRGLQVFREWLHQQVREDKRSFAGLPLPPRFLHR